MGASKFQVAESEREAVKVNLDFLEDELMAHNTTPLGELHVDQHIDMISDSKTKLAAIHVTLMSNAPANHDLDPCKAEHKALMGRAIAIFSALRAIKLGFAVLIPATFPTSSSSSSSFAPDIKLPRLELPTFGGNIQEWVAFRDMFESAIGSKPSITKTQKLTYLKSCLTGEASRLVRSLVVSDANYDIAWKSLTDRYANERELLFAIIRRFLAQPNVNSNASSLRTLIDTSKECIRSLEALRIPVKHWSAILLYILFNKLDQQSKELWEQTLKDTSIPNIEDLFCFLEQRARALAAGNGPPRPPVQNHNNKPDGYTHRRSAHTLHAQSISTCIMQCDSNHPIYKCAKFLALQPRERSDLVNQKHLCRNCLSNGHYSSRCESKHTCRTCSQKHHTLLHYPGGAGPTPLPQISANGTSSVSSHHIQDTELQTALLATAVVKVLDDQGEPQPFRALLDGGSSVSFMTSSFARKINLFVSNSSTHVTGLQASSVGTSHGSTSVVIKPRFDSDVSYSITALTIPRITTKQPTAKCDRNSWPHLKNLFLADPQFDTPSNVDLLLGADVFWNLILPNKIEGSQNSPVAINSQFGWLVAGPQQPISKSVTSFITDVNLDNQLKRFWEVETVSDQPARTTEERACEEHFAATHTGDETGRFTVHIPWKSPRPPVGSSREHALSRLQQLEKRLAVHDGIKDPKRREDKQHQRAEYNKFMQQYEEMGHMTLVPEPEVVQPKNPTAYIPHHFIQKESSTTTKFRVVFDASAKTSSSYSVNDMMIVGPTIQDSLFDITIRFRTHNIVFTADIEKMYRQIIVAPVDRDMQRILWRETPHHPVREYWLNTVTYGTAAAPYLATKSLQQCADDGAATYPLGSAAVKEDSYVDDLMSGSKTTTTAISTVKELNDLCMSGGFPLRKWTCNNEEVLASLPDDLKETKSLIPIDDDHSVKTLGIFWNPREDNYHFNIHLPPDMPGTYTKRKILSEMSKIFDPLGWLAPVIIQAKIFMQRLWMEYHDWDTRLPEPIQQQWSTFKSTLMLLEDIKIPRCVIPNNPYHVKLCGFSDASESAYSAVIYTVCYYHNEPPISRIITSKTRVAPVKAATLPRLELSGAVLLSQLFKIIIRAMKIKFDEIRCYTDSTIVLAWISSSPLRWKTYVRNRVQEIHDNIPTATWFHVSGETNPADCASRGITPAELINHPLWWSGNTEMQLLNPPEIPSKLDVLEIVKHEEKQQITVHHTTLSDVNNIFQSMCERISSWSKLQRVRAWMLRFTNNSKIPLTDRVSGPLTTAELNTSMLNLVKVTQHQEFKSEIKLLTERKQLLTNSKLLSLSPFVDNDGILRVGGRLKNAPISHNQRHPMLLPKNHHITTLIIRSIHQRHFHAGPQLVLSIINQKFWIIRGKDAVRYEIHKCVICTRHKGETMTQFMGELPAARVTPNPPFSVCGVDYAGPFSIKPPTRSNITLKSWLAIFVCFVTKAIHLEVVCSLSTEHFIAALRRFTSRRGLPTSIYSDCGTNFVGAKRVINDLFYLCSSKPHNDKVADECASNGIQWHMNPPGGPHFGGLWEAGVKSIKHHLYRVTGSALLTYEEMETLVVQIEALLNSRPIIPGSSDPSDLSALTPAHFLIGRPLTCIPHPDVTDENIGRLRRWQLIQQQKQLFWKRWSNEFISRMQQRPKWMRHTAELQINDMVIIKDERLPPLKWKLGRVLKVHPGADNHVRVATVKTSEGEFIRPVRKLCHLPIETTSIDAPPQV